MNVHVILTCYEPSVPDRRQNGWKEAGHYRKANKITHMLPEARQLHGRDLWSCASYQQSAFAWLLEFDQSSRRHAHSHQPARLCLNGIAMATVLPGRTTSFSSCVTRYIGNVHFCLCRDVDRLCAWSGDCNPKRLQASPCHIILRTAAGMEALAD